MSSSVLVSLLVTILVIALILYLVGMLPFSRSVKQLARAVVLIIGILVLLKYLAIF